jgi:hypothetical protein
MKSLKSNRIDKLNFDSDGGMLYQLYSRWWRWESNSFMVEWDVFDARFKEYII